MYELEIHGFVDVNDPHPFAVLAMKGAALVLRPGSTLVMVNRLMPPLFAAIP
jgi:hypothetical protein